jgi:hypothetical protein
LTLSSFVKFPPTFVKFCQGNARIPLAVLSVFNSLQAKKPEKVTPKPG